MLTGWLTVKPRHCYRGDDVMPIPDGWKGSNLRSRADVVQWLHRHGDEADDPAGLLVGRMRTEMGVGRALSQLLSDMDRDGMIHRDVRGRRTFGIKLLDDWGLLETTSVASNTSSLVTAQRAAVAEAEAASGAWPAEIDYDALAESLLVRCMKKANAPSMGAEVEKWRERAERLQAELAETKDQLILARDEADEQRRQATSMRGELIKLQSGTASHAARKGTPLRELLSESDARMLDRLMRELPASR